MTRQFDSPGAENTDAVLRCVLERLEPSDIQHVVVATTTGETGVRFLDLLEERSVQLVAVTHHMGFREPNQIELELSLIHI